MPFDVLGREEEEEMISIGKKFNLLMVLMIIASSIPWPVDASSNDVGLPNAQNDAQVETVHGGGYFGNAQNQIISGGSLSSLPYEGVMANGYYKVGRNYYAPGDEVIEKRTENSKTRYLGTVGKAVKFGVDTSMGPIHYKDDYSDVNEQWKDIDTTIIDGVITKAPYMAVIDYPNKSVTMTDKRTGSVTTLSLQSLGGNDMAGIGTAVESGSTVSWGNVATDTDLKIVAENTRISFQRILKSPNADTSASFSVSQTGDGIKLISKASDGVKKDIPLVTSVSAPVVGKLGMSKSMASSGNSVDSSSSGTDLVNGTLSEDVDTENVGAITYPLTIDPVLDISVGAGTDDTSMSYSAGAWIYAGTGSTIIRAGGAAVVYSLAWFWRGGGGMRFQNITIPKSAMITNAYLNMTCDTSYSMTTVNSRICGDAEDNAATFSTQADYQARRGTAAGGANNNLRTVANVTWDNLPAWTAGNHYVSPNISSVVQEIVNRAGWASGNSIAVFWDDHEGRSTMPTGDSQYYQRSAYSYDGSAANAPILHVEYTSASAPTVTTQSASSVTATGATLNGNITNWGGENSTIQGFAWGTTSNSTTPGSGQSPPATYSSNYSASGSFGNGTFSYSGGTFSSGTTYYYRAYAKNTGGWGWSSEQSFLTIPAAPTAVSATDGSSTSEVTVTWTKSTGATDYAITRNGTGVGGWLGDVAIYHDTSTGAGTITAGNAAASDGSSNTSVILSISGMSGNSGTSYSYTVKAKNATGNSTDSSADIGYRGVGVLSYQWWKSVADSPSGYLTLVGGTTNPYNDTSAPVDGSGRYFMAVISATGASSANTTEDRGFVGNPPIVSTSATTSILTTTATGNGNVVGLNGGTNCVQVGIEYSTIPSSPYAFNSHLDGSYGVGAFTVPLTSLQRGTLYYYRAYAARALGTGYGEEGQFLTKPEVPTSLSAAYINTTAIQLTWTQGLGSSYTYIRASNVTYPLLVTDGSLVANTTLSTVAYGGLNSLNTYYISAWGWISANASSQYSDSYATTHITIPSGVPTVYTNVSTGYGNDWGTVVGLVALTYPNPTIFGFQYGVNSTYLPSWSNTTSVVSGGIFSSTISGLTPGVTYYYRAFAANSYGTGYGSVLSFSTGGGGIGGGGTLYESYTYGCNTTWNTNYEAFTTMGSNWTTVQGQNWVAQNFTASSSHSVNQVVIWVKRTATAAAGYIYVGIRDANSGQPNTPDLGLGLYAIAYTSTSGGPIEISLENEIQIESGKNYAIVIRAPGADATNYVQVQFNTAGGASGQMETSTDGGVAWTGGAYDINYTIIGKPQPVYGNIQAAQTFLVGTTPHTVQRVRLILGRVGQPGNVYVSIRNYTGGVLSSADLATVALNGNAITLDKAMYDCVLTPEKSLEANKSYAIVVTAPSGDRYNYVLWCADVSSAGAGYAGGTALASVNAGLSWTTVAADYMFEVWGNSVLAIINAKVFKNYLATGDWLITTEVLNVSPPYYDKNEDPSAFYMVSFMGLVGTTYAATPCELWNKSPVAIYLNPTQASALSWGGNYKVRVGDLNNVVYAEYALISTDWNSSSLTYLDNWARLTAKDMEAYITAKTGTAVSYTTYVANKGYVLNQDGGAIFSQACPRLAYVRPNLFQITSNQPDITTTAAPANVGFFNQDYHLALGSYLSGMIDDGAVAAGIGDAKVFGGVIMLALYAIVAFGTVMKGFAWAGMIAGFPVILLGMYYGLLDVTMIIIFLIIMTFLFVREFFFKGM